MPDKQFLTERELSLLARWSGAQARLWSYQITHKVLTIRLEAEDKDGNLHVVVVDTHFVQAPSVWLDSMLEISLKCKDSFGDPVILVSDRSADVRILGGGVGLQENVQPLMKVLCPREHTLVLEEYIKLWRS
jgi:hypothetical protein